MFETSDLNTIKTLLANKPQSVMLLEVDDNSISKRIKFFVMNNFFYASMNN